MDSPKAPDPYQTANTQQTFNKDAAVSTANLNHLDQSTPYGSTNWSQTGTNPDGTPKYGVNTSFTPVGQGLFDANNSVSMGRLGAANGLLQNGQGALSGKGLDLSYDGTAARLDSLEHARLDPQWQQNSDQQESKLANQGITAGTPAYDNAMRVFNQGKNDAYNSAHYMDYGQSIAAKQAEYNSPLSTLQGLTNGTSPAGPTSGNVSTPQANVAGTNYAGLAEQNYQQQSQNANSQNGQIAGLIGTAASIGAAPFTGGLSLGGLGGSMGGLFGGGNGGSGGRGMGSMFMGGGSPSGY